MKNKARIIKLLKFFGIYIGIIALYYVFISIDDNPVFDAYINFTSYLSGIIIRIFDNSVVINQQIISGKTFNIILAFGCEGSEPIAVFAAGVLAYPSNIKSKLKGLGIGLPALYILNLIRIALLYSIGLFFPTVFDLFHTTLFPILFILIALIFWVLWIKLIADIK